MISSLYYQTGEMITGERTLGTQIVPGYLSPTHNRCKWGKSNGQLWQKIMFQIWQFYAGFWMNLIHIFNSSSLVINHPVAIFHQDSKFQNREQVTLWFPWWGSASVVVFILYTSPHGLHQVLALFTLTPLYAMMACYVCSNAERWSESSFSLERKNITAFPLLKFWSQIWMFYVLFWDSFQSLPSSFEVIWQSAWPRGQ